MKFDWIQWATDAGTADQLGGPRDEVTLFRGKDADAWCVLAGSFSILLALDFYFFSAGSKRISIGMACLVTLFWIACAGGFNAFVLFRFGDEAAWQWASAYALEWLLSFDNLFVFHSIFKAFKTPENMRHRPLFIGIVGAVLLRLSFLSFAEYLMHSMWWVHFALGAVIIVIAVKSLMADDDSDDQPHWVAAKLSQILPLVDYYEQTGSFFVKVSVTPEGRVAEPPSQYGAVAMHSTRKAWRGTTLLLVLLTLEAADLLFAVDSVSAIVAQVNDLFLAYSAVVFAMLGLRAGYFVVDVLAATFEMFQYGIAVILIFIGVKLMLSSYVSIRPEVVCVFLVATLAASVGLSWCLGHVRQAPEPVEEEDEALLGSSAEVA